MTGAVGDACLVVGLGAALYAVGASVYGARSGRREYVTSARRAMYCLAGLLTVAMVMLESAYLRTDLSYKLVAQNSSTDTPTFYKLTAMWSSQEGSLLLWAFLLSVYSSVVLFVTRRRLRERNVDLWFYGVVEAALVHVSDYAHHFQFGGLARHAATAML